MTVPPRKLCVYCGSGPGRDPRYLEAARSLGKAMAEAGIGLVYGGGSLGLMGEAGPHRAGRRRPCHRHHPGIPGQQGADADRSVNELIVTQNMHERKMTMFERASGFVALPGGLGTLEELTEISTWAQLEQHAKPIILCNIERLLGSAGHAPQSHARRRNSSARASSSNSTW